jgi:predicted outer membrane protein
MTRSILFVPLALIALAVDARAQNPAPGQQDRGSNTIGQADDVSDSGRPAQGVTGQSTQNVAGQPAQGQYAATAQQPGQGGQNLDQAIAGCLLLGNNEELALAEFAQSRTQNPQVKEFVQMMITDHEKAVSKLTQVAPQLAQSASAIREGGQTAQATSSNGAQQAQPAQAGAAGNQLFALEQRVAQECLALTQKELGQKQGAEFDQCYVGQQVGAHIGMLAKLRGSQQFASGQLKQIIQESEQTVQMHLDHAKKLAEQLKGENAPRQTSQRPTVGQPQPLR